MFASAIESLLAGHCPPQAVRAIERGAHPQALAAAFRDAGFFDLMTPEDLGGAGAEWPEFCEVLMALGHSAVPVPLAQTLAVRAFASDPGSLPQGLLTFAPALRREGASVVATAVPGAALAQHVLGVLDGRFVLLDTADARLALTGIHASALGTLEWPAAAARPFEARIAPDGLQPFAALVHAALLAGAMRRCFDMTMDYANQRSQFGKSIGKFQAIQHQLAVMAGHVAAARMAALTGFGRGAAWPSHAACAVAKGRTSEAAQAVASIAHAIHGAIGITEEYDLQLYTRRLHEWRLAHGSEAMWYPALGREVLKDRTLSAAGFARAVAP